MRVKTAINYCRYQDI